MPRLLVAIILVVTAGIDGVLSATPAAADAGDELYCRDWNGGGYCIDFRLRSDNSKVTCLRTLPNTGSCDRLYHQGTGQRWECVAYNDWHGWCEEWISPNAPTPPPPDNPGPPAPDPNEAALPVAAAPVAASPAGQPTRLVPLGPVRVMDTRRDRAAVDPRMYLRVDLAAYIGRNPDDALYATTAVALNITATDANAEGYLSAFACGTERPDTSVVNFTPSAASATHAIVAIGANRDVCIYASTGAHVIVDLFGAYTTGDGRVFQPNIPLRVLDSRAAQSAPLPSGTRSVVAIPYDGAAAAMVNVTAASPTDTGYVTAWPCDQPQPDVSTLNFTAADGARANGATVPVSAAGELCVFNSAPTHLVVDLLGRFDDSSTGLWYQAATPVRVLDTRTGTGGWQGRMGQEQTIQFDVPGDGLVAVGNLTAVEARATGYLTLWRSANDRPTASSLNFDPADTLPNFAPVITGTDRHVSLYTGQGFGQHVLYDLTGWFLQP